MPGSCVGSEQELSRAIDQVTMKAHMGSVSPHPDEERMKREARQVEAPIAAHLGRLRNVIEMAELELGHLRAALDPVTSDHNKPLPAPEASEAPPLGASGITLQIYHAEAQVWTLLNQMRNLSASLEL